jgi:hypothetical protein
MPKNTGKHFITALTGALGFVSAYIATATMSVGRWFITIVWVATAALWFYVAVTIATTRTRNRQ